MALGSVGVPTGIVICKETSEMGIRNRLLGTRELANVSIKSTGIFQSRTNVIPIILHSIGQLPFGG